MLPPPPSVADLKSTGIRSKEALTWKTSMPVWRVHATVGSHVLPWDAHRTWGPVLRFDQHPLPVGEHPRYGIWYGAADPRGALAEVFQETRVIDRHTDAKYLTGLRFTRPLRLLDVGGIGVATWITRAGGNHGLDSAPHRRSQQWARAIHSAFDEIDGIAYRGRFAGGTCVALFERTAGDFPANPLISLPLSHPGLEGRIATAAMDLGYKFL
ncbi:RES family NAD+ phosphorylase [Gordonia sp. CPCC 205333]|uniref:RES family NAD+ phosphorylase n=1 Tax=Gordonia sp. CPCC 205333 TaxID=3140790 RepID=UPI003AF3BF06